MSFRENSKKHVIQNVKQGLPAFQMESPHASTIKNEAVGLCDCDPKLKTQVSACGSSSIQLIIATFPVQSSLETIIWCGEQKEKQHL
jgi:hypothetical protein